MTLETTPDQSEPNQVAKVFAEILSALPSGCASLQWKEEGKEAPEEVSVLPSNAASAQFGAIFFGGSLYGAFFGREPFLTTYEAPSELHLSRRDGFDKHLGRLKKMCEAVVAGRCDHRVGLFSITGTIAVSDESPLRVVDLPMFHPRRVRTRIIYEPYDRRVESAERPTAGVSV